MSCIIGFSIDFLTSATKFSNFHCVAYSSYIESPSLVKVQTSLHSPLSTTLVYLLHARMAYNWSVLLLTTALITLVLVNCEESSVKPSYETDACPWCNTRFRRCCGGAISNYFRSSQFENIFSNRNSLEVDAHEVGFWDYQSFITASADYQPYGFGTTYRKLLGMKELAAFLAHVATKTTCKL